MPEITQFSDSLNLPPGARFVDSRLRVVNEGEIVPSPDNLAGGYIHHASGGFAVVFHARDAREEVALRCWKRTPPANAVAACRALTAFLAAHPSPYFVRQEYIEQAVWIENVWYPALLMEWASGDPLNIAVEKRLRDTSALRRLADGFERMTLDLQKAGIAHGDLQHANLLVGADDALKLVDYDSVWVPQLDGKGCEVVGKEGYGHPDYIKKHAPRPFNRFMDTFAGLVMLCSLRAFALDPALYQKFTKENLLFRPEDLEAPETSPAFAALDKLKDDTLRPLVAALREMCRDRQKAEALLEPLLSGLTSRIVAPTLPTFAPMPPLALQADTHFAFLTAMPDVWDTPKPAPTLYPIGFSIVDRRSASQMTFDDV